MQYSTEKREIGKYLFGGASMNLRHFPHSQKSRLHILHCVSYLTFHILELVT